MPASVRQRLEPFAEMLAGETLAVTVRWVDAVDGAALTLADQPLSIELAATARER
jgi:hypothetical protein